MEPFWYCTFDAYMIVLESFTFASVFFPIHISGGTSKKLLTPKDLSILRINFFEGFSKNQNVLVFLEPYFIMPWEYFFWIKF